MEMERSATQVLRENLAQLMSENEGLRTQMELAKAAGVDQKTISNCLREEPILTPGGKISSPTLYNLDKIARAFGLQVWQLLMPMPKTDVREKAKKEPATV